MSKKKILVSIVLVCIGVGSLICCSNNKAKASTKNYLNYCGTQGDVLGDKSVAIYEDKVHNKVVYVGTDGFQHPITIAVSDLDEK